MESDGQSLTVYFDGACPLCQAEINHYRKQEGAGVICFLDVSRSEETLAGDLTKQQAMKRFHVRGNDGLLLSGAAAFVAVWSTLPRWRLAARLAELPGILKILEVAYRFVSAGATGHFKTVWARAGLASAGQGGLQRPLSHIC